MYGLSTPTQFSTGGKTYTGVIQALQRVGGSIFYKDFKKDNGLPADYYGGSAKETFTCDRTGATVSPGTYIDANGVIQLMAATDDTKRQTWGYYDSTGFHLATGLLYEPAAKNNCPYSYTYENAAWDKTNVTADDDDTGSSSPDGTATVSSLTATGNNGTVLLHTAVTAQTYSIWLKRKTGTGTISITADGTNYSAVTVLSGWARFNVVAASSASQICGIKIGTSGDAVYAWVSQFEAGLVMSSTIPNATVALTRNAESLSYNSSNNFPAPGGNNCLMFNGSTDVIDVPAGAGSQMNGRTAFSAECLVYLKTLPVGSRIFDNINYTTTAGWRLYFNTDKTISASIRETTTKTTTTTETISLNAWHHVAMTWATGETPKIYLDGSVLSSSSNAVTTPDDDHLKVLHIGNVDTSDRGINGYLRDARIYAGKTLTPAEVATRASGGTVAGATAIYPLNEGSLTAATDTVAANNGTITGTQWTKDYHAGTMVLKCRPIMFPNEQSAVSSSLLKQYFTDDATDKIHFTYPSNNTDNNVNFSYRHYDTAFSISSGSTPFTRYASYTLIGTFSTATGTKFYINGVSVGTPLAYYYIPIGTLASTFSLGTVPMMVEQIAIFNRALRATEASSVHTLLQ